MSNHWNEEVMERLYEEGLEEGIKKGLEGNTLEFFAERYAKKIFNERGM